MIFDASKGQIEIAGAPGKANSLCSQMMGACSELLFYI